MASFDYDVLIIGSGFGGSVAALRDTDGGNVRGLPAMDSKDALKRIDAPLLLPERSQAADLRRAAGDQLHAFDDLCTCAGHAAAAGGGESDG